VGSLWGRGVVEFRILGPLEVLDGATPIAVPGAKERALLADLLVHAGRVVAADRLMEDLWGERPPGNPANTLQGRVSALRRALGPVAARLTTRPPGYRLDVDPELVDAARFERLAGDATRIAASDPARALGLLAEALGLWRGPVLAGFAISRGRRLRRPGWTSCAWPLSSCRPSCGWPPAATASWSASWRDWSPHTPYASDFGAS
jgi:DNA-binding winged helix-turn-helix (wHTH) protein